MTSMRTRLIDYAPWMLRDYATNQGPSTLIVLALMAFLSVFPLFIAGNFGLRQVPELIAKQMLQQLTPTLAFIGALFATNGIVSNDRRMGYYRFFFAKPLNPVLYYSLQFVTALVGMMLVTLVLLAIYAGVVRPVFPYELFFVVAVMFVSWAGIGFLLSATWRFDWLSLVTIVLVANVVRAIWKDATGWKRVAMQILPPVHKTDSVYAIIMSPDTDIPWKAIAWLVGYGLACFALGLVAIRKRPFGTG